MRRRTIVLLAVGGSAVALVGAAYGYLVVSSSDAPERASLPAAPRTVTGGPARADGEWTVAALPSNFVGYRIRERLGPVAAPSDAVGRTREVSGSAAIGAGALTTLDIRIDPATLASNSARRDGFVRDAALDTATFPTAEFRLREPVELGAPTRGQVVRMSVPGRLTLRGETRPARFRVAARWNGPTIQAAGSARIERADFGIDVSSRAGFNIDEQGTIEFELTFAPAGAAVATPPPTLVERSPFPEDDEQAASPCRGGSGVRLDPEVLVTAAGDGVTRVATVHGANRRRDLQVSTGLTGGVSWSPDGTELVYSSSDAPAAPRTLWISAAGGGTPVAVPGLRDVTHPDWGPDGRIVFVQWRGEGDSDLWVVDADGGNARVLVETPGIDTDPRWSPDGRELVFTTVTEKGNQDVVVVDADGRGAEPLAGGPGYEYAPSFAPDGRHVVFVRDGSIVRVARDGGRVRRLTRGTADTNPAVSPDGRRLALLRDGSLFVARADGSSPRCVTTGTSVGGGPRWRP
jgi:polyisoprenoid-binding protein YceI